MHGDTENREARRGARGLRKKGQPETQEDNLMKNRVLNSKTTLMAPVILMAILFFATGCDLATPVQEDPDLNIASSLAQSAQTSAAVEQNLLLLNQFENPLSSLAEDGGLYGDADSEFWSGEGVDFPNKSVRAADDILAFGNLSSKAASFPALTRRMMESPDFASGRGNRDAPGDTIDVHYYHGPDTLGLDALVWEDPAADLVRYVVQHEYAPILGQIIRREQELLFDTGGTLEDPADDLYHRFDSEEQWFGGEIDINSVAPLSGSGPIEAGVQVRAYMRVDEPRFHPLQLWTESELIADMGEFQSAEDDLLYSLESTIYWRNDAVHHVTLEDPLGGAIEPGVILEARGDFTAAPINDWLESISDTVRVDMGELGDPDDDLLHGLSRLSIFDGSAVDGGNPRNYVHMVPESPVTPGEEPCGGQASQDVWYAEDWWLVHLVREADINCDGSGSLYVLMEYQDGTSHEQFITWDGQGTATLEEDRADGTRVEGSWSESDGSYAVETTYPAGEDPVSRDQHGSSLEGSVEAWDIYEWQDGRADETYFTSEGDEGSFTASGHREYEELYEEFTLSASEDEFTEGSWNRNDGAYGEFRQEALEGGGAHVVFSAADPNAEGDPSLEGEIWFAPDGSGTGTVSVTQWGNTVTYTIEFGPDGSDMEIS